jgi:drug/metabolite transporter (DMT)-like permease
MRKDPKQAIISGILWMLLASTLFAAGNAMVKELSTRLPFWQAVFARGIVALAVVTLHNLRTGTSFLGVNRVGLLARGVLGATSLTCYYYAITGTDLGVAVMVAHTSPLFVTLFAFIFLRERLHPSLLLLIGLGFAGASLILVRSLGGFDYHAIFALASAGLAGGAYTTLRQLRKTERSSTVVFYYAMVSTLVSVGPTAATFVLPTGLEALMLLGIGLISAVAQFGLTFSYRQAPASVVSPFSYWTVVMSYGYGVLLFGEVPTWTAIAGSVVVTLSGVLIAVIEHRSPAPEGDHAAMGVWGANNSPPMRPTKAAKRIS